MNPKLIKTTIVLWILLLPICALAPTDITLSTIYYSGSYMKETNESVFNYPSVFPLTDDDKNWIEQTLNGMSVLEKCGQMIMPWALGNYISDDSKEFKRLSSLVRDLKVGGIIFFKGDIMNEALIINKLQDLANVSLLMASDFERGLGMRLTDGLEFPYNMAVAATGKPELSYKMARAVSAECRAMGVHQNYAPVADVNNNAENPIINIRAYSEDKDIVSEFSNAYIAGAAEEIVLTTVKHFPGHGDTKIDSHQDLPVINIDRLNLAANELVPFAEAIRAGVHSVMVGHLAVPAIEPEPRLPATLSKVIISDLLKGEMGFEGLVVTDAMNMSAITKYYSTAEATILAIKAGVDILLMPPDEEVAVYAIKSAVETGDIDIKQIDNSVRKILAAKRWLRITNNKFSNIEELNKVIGKKSHYRLAEEIAEKSITLVRDEKSILPLDPKKIYRTSCITLTDGSGSDGIMVFQNEVENNFGYVAKTVLTKRSRAIDYSNALQIAKQSDLILVPAFVKVKAYQGTVSLPDEHVKFINNLLKLKTPVVLISFGNPYLLSLFPKAKIYLTAYGDPAVSQRAMVNALIGENSITGRLPISIPNTEHKIGDGIIVENSFLKFSAAENDTNYDFRSIDQLMTKAVEEKIFPGGVLLIGHKSKVIYEKAFGKFTYEENSNPFTIDAIFDLASLSKVVGTTSAAMFLFDEKKLNLDEKVSAYIPEFGTNEKENITVRNLLLHNSGLIAYRNFTNLYPGRDEVLSAIMNEKLEYPTGNKAVYSDLNMIVLQQVIEKLSGKKLDEFLAEKLFKPLKMNRTMYNPPKELWYYCPPTSDSNDPLKRNKGVVHDGNAFILEGVAGHAGLFSTAGDLAIFMRLMLQHGKYGNKQYIKPSTITAWLKNQSKESSRALGWDTNFEKNSAAGELFSEKSFGHTGFTGTSMWADDEKDLFVILLTNRVYPDGTNTGIINFRPLLHTEVIKVLMEWFSNVSWFLH
jgi:beta-glucosidase-like glycosyl hydrolase/CubicO group peptidase (beta-lactamase class C family)